MPQADLWRRDQDTLRGQWTEKQTRKCTEEKDKGYNNCTEEKDKGYNNCTEEKDKGYNNCTEEKDKGYNECCDWWPCSWACDALVWVSNIVCVMWTWVSNIVCMAWTWISNVVCVMWTWVSNIVCVAWTWAVDKVWAAGTILAWAVGKVYEWATGRGRSPISPEDGTLPDLSNVTFDHNDDQGNPVKFLWGVATASYQVEGKVVAVTDDNPVDDPHANDWHVFTRSQTIKDRVKAVSTLGGETQPLLLESAAQAIRHSNIEVLKQDLDRAKLLGMNAYRFSVEWSWLQPKPPANGPSRGDFDEEALEYYDVAISEMRHRGLTPILTLNHLTLPTWVLTPPRAGPLIAVADEGFNSSLRGWESEKTVEVYMQFVEFIVRRYKDVVDYWMTMNEPVGSLVAAGYLAGVWPPGFTGANTGARSAYFNLIKAHVKAYNKIKEIYGTKLSMVGFAHQMMFARTTGAGTLETVGRGAVTGVVSGAVVGAIIGGLIGGPIGAIAGAQLGAIAGVVVGSAYGSWIGFGNINEAAKNQLDYFYNYHFLDAITTGTVDKAIQRRPSNRENQDSKQFFDISVEEWKPALDFIGLNYYRSIYVYYDQIVASTVGFSGGLFHNDLHKKDEGHNLLNELGWEISPEGMHYLLAQMTEKYKKDNRPIPILISENGIPEYADRNRAPFIVAHLQQVLRSIKEGINVLGYIHWSLLDNFEWAYNYRCTARFGLFKVDRDSRELHRHMTDGALALQYIVAEGKLGQAVEKFGTISPRGDKVVPPSKTFGAFWEYRGEAGDVSRDPGSEEGFTLYLTRLQDGRFLGMIFYHEWWGDRQRYFDERHKWFRLESIIFDETHKILRFSHHYVEPFGIDKVRVYQAQALNGDLVEGTVTPHYIDGNSVPETWNAHRLTFSGLWRSESPPFIFYLSKMEGDCDFGAWSRRPENRGDCNSPSFGRVPTFGQAAWSGKFFSDPFINDASWYPFDAITVDVTSLPVKLLPLGPPMITSLDISSVSSDRIKGTIDFIDKEIGAQSTWEAKRVTDDISF